MPDKKARVKSTLRKLAPRAVRAHRILTGQLRGRIIVTSLHDYPAAILGRTEGPLLTWFRRNVRLGETWLDVGAHYGYTSIAIAELVGVTGRVYAFEPSLTTVGYLNQTRNLNNLDQMTILPFGLGAPGGIRIISVPVERGMANHAFGGDVTEPICVVGLDYLWTALDEPDVNGIKIDVQGMELPVLEGMELTLRVRRPKLIVEFHQGVDRDTILKLLEGLYYRLPGVPIDPQPGQAYATYSDDCSYFFEPRSR